MPAKTLPDDFVRCYATTQPDDETEGKVMLATLTSKGQVTIPKAARDALHLNPGDRVEFVLSDHGRLFLLPVSRSVLTLKGLLPKPSAPVSLEAMDEAILQAVRS
jgi:AbrB family looped-hinge helix DNA binding protein